MYIDYILCYRYTLPIAIIQLNIAPMRKKSDFVVIKQQRCRPTCTSAQSDQWLCYIFRGILYVTTTTCYNRLTIFIFLTWSGTPSLYVEDHISIGIVDFNKDCTQV